MFWSRIFRSELCCLRHFPAFTLESRNTSTNQLLSWVVAEPVGSMYRTEPTNRSGENGRGFGGGGVCDTNLLPASGVRRARGSRRHNRRRRTASKLSVSSFVSEGKDQQLCDSGTEGKVSKIAGRRREDPIFPLVSVFKRTSCWLSAR